MTAAPTPARVREVASDGLVLDVDDAGPLDGEVVVLLHGFPERATCWREVAPRLHAAGLRTLAVDQRGYSPRARPGRRRDYAVPHLVEDVAAVVRAAGDGPVHLVGHDWGAVVAWTLAGTRPDLVRTLTALSVPHPGAFARATVHSRQALRSWYMAAFCLPVLPERAARRPGGPLDRMLRRTGLDDAGLARFRREVVDDGALPGALGWYRALPLAARGGPPPGRVRVPTTFVWSDGDTAVDRWGAEHCGDLVAADYALVVLEGRTHWLPTQAPDDVADAVLARVRGAGSPGAAP